MPGEMDLNVCIDRVCPGANYRLNRANPPHFIIEWRDARPKPTERELEDAWVDYKLDVLAKDVAIDNFRMENAEYEALLPSGEIITLYLRRVTT
jgi:hypothetical protein